MERHLDFIPLLVVIVCLVLSIWLTKTIVEADIPMWIKFLLLK